jgi:hypothetical protein
MLVVMTLIADDGFGHCECDTKRSRIWAGNRLRKGTHGKLVSSPCSFRDSQGQIRVEYLNTLSLLNSRPDGTPDESQSLCAES